MPRRLALVDVVDPLPPRPLVLAVRRLSKRLRAADPETTRAVEEVTHGQRVARLSVLRLRRRPVQRPTRVRGRVAYTQRVVGFDLVPATAEVRHSLERVPVREGEITVRPGRKHERGVVLVEIAERHPERDELVRVQRDHVPVAMPVRRREPGGFREHARLIQAHFVPLARVQELVRHARESPRQDELRRRRLPPRDVVRVRSVQVERLKKPNLLVGLVLKDA